jgi:hypothetical protein
MFAYTIRVLGLVVLISGFMTLVTMLVLEQILTTPVLKLRDDLAESGA